MHHRIALPPVPVIFKIKSGKELFSPKESLFQGVKKKDFPNLLGRERK